MAAVRDRYGKIEDENAGVITEDLYVVGGKKQTTVVEMVGARKVNDLQRYRHIMLYFLSSYFSAFLFLVHVYIDG